MVKIADKSEKTFKTILSHIKKQLEDAAEAVAAKWVRENSHRG